MENLILAIHYFVCSFLIVVILLQAGKGADIGAVFGGGSGTVFGSRGAATFLGKLTTVMAIVFLLTSISLAYISRNKSESSILKTVPESTDGKLAPELIPGITPGPSPTAEAKKPEATPGPETKPEKD